MFEEILPKGTKNALAILGESKILDDAYLAGGTALALQIGHRTSVDLDFFSSVDFDEKSLVERLSSLPVDFKLENMAWKTILGFTNKTKFSLFFYDYKWLDKPKEFLGVKVASIKDIAPMKVLAISDRGAKRDFVDLYFILAVEKLYTLEEVFNLYDEKFKVFHQNRTHILKSLTYFKEADEAPMPQMLKEVSWTKVKKFFELETKFLIKKLSSF